MSHNLFRNTTDKPLKHPATGQTIMPGQMYAEPEEMEHVEPSEMADSDLIVQTVADPEATQKAAAAQKRKQQASEQA